MCKRMSKCERKGLRKRKCKSERERKLKRKRKRKSKCQRILQQTQKDTMKN